MIIDKKSTLLILLLLLSLIRSASAAPTTSANITITDPNGVKVINNKAMTCSSTGSGTYTGSAFNSNPTVCGSNTTSASSINQSNASCTYAFTKNYTVNGAWTANVTFFYTGYENTGIRIENLNGTGSSAGNVDNDTAPTGQAKLDCTGNTICNPDPQCNATSNESVNGTLYTINWDSTQADCVGYGKIWYTSITSGSTGNCCGDDPPTDNFYYWSGTTCMYCNAGANNSASTKCSASASTCSSYGSPASCHAADSGGGNWCCYGVGCSSTGAAGSETNMVGGNCTCTDGLCANFDGGNGECMNESWAGAGCYTGVSCASTGWTFSSYYPPPNNPTNLSITPSPADPDTTLNVTGNVTESSPRGNLQILVYWSTASSPTDPTLCTGSSVVTGNISYCSITASTVSCSPGNCTVKLLTNELTADRCGDIRYSPSFVNVSFTYRDRNVSPPILNAPASDPSIMAGSTFVLNCTPITGNASTGINMSFQFNSTSADWANLSSSGGLTTTQTNPIANVLNATAYAINVTGSTAGTYWVRCQAYNSSYKANSTAQQVTINKIPPSINMTNSSYPNCGGVFYKVSFYDTNSKLTDSSFSLKIIDSNAVTALTQVALNPNNGTGVYLGNYSLNATSALGTWLIKATVGSGLSAAKNFFVVTTCGDGVCAGGETHASCPVDCP